MSLSVIIPSKTARNLSACVEAVRKHEPAARIIVIDDGLCGWSDTLDVFRIGGVKPFIFARNVNLGINATREPIDVSRMQDVEPKYVPAPFRDDVVLLNDDALLETPYGFSLLQEAAAQHPEYGLISATTNLAGNTQQLPRGIGLREADRVVAFVCVYIPRRTIEKVGLLDERFTAYGWEDNDYCRRVRAAGLKLGVHDGCYVNHGSLRSTFRGDPKAAGDISKGMAIYRAKWGDLR
jgi:glycosyltransferase involved in cell wall biosynthesis